MSDNNTTAVAPSSHAQEESTTQNGVIDLDHNTRKRYANGRCTNVYKRATCSICGNQEFPNERAACARAKAWAERQIERDNSSRSEDPRPAPAPWFAELFDNYDDYEWNG